MSDVHPRLPLLRLAWRNTRRNSRRTLLTVSAVLVASAALTFAFAYLGGVVAEIVDTYARIQSGHVRITARGYTDRERFLPLDKNVPRLSELLPIIRSHPAVRTAVARIRTAALVDGLDSNRPALVWGIDLERERDILRPGGMMDQGRLPVPGRAEALVGTGLAGRIGVAPGDTLTLLGQTAYRSLGGLRCTVVGLARTGVAYLDEALLLLPLDQAQYMTFLDDAATEVLVFARDPDQAEVLAASLAAELDPLVEGGLEVLSWRDQGPLMQLADSINSMWGIIIFLLMLMAGLVIVNTMLMSVMERTAEFGMLNALGMRRRDILRLVLGEGMVIGLIGAVTGVLLGGAIALIVEHTGLDITKAASGIELPFPNVIYPHLKPLYPVVALFIGVFTAVLAALFPALKAVRLQPAEALRS